MNSILNKQEVIDTAVDLRSKGLTWAKIRDVLEEKGFRNNSGKPYSEGGIHTIVSLKRPDVAFRQHSQNLISKTQSHTVSTKTVPTSENKTLANREKGIIDLSKTIINLSGVSANEKIKLLSGVLGL